MNPLTEVITSEMRAVGLEAELLKETYYPEQFGNAIVTYRLGPMLLKFLRDRSLDTLEIASANSPNHFHLFCDIEIAMGWKSLDEVLAMQEVEPLRDVIGRIKLHLNELKQAFSRDLSLFTKTKLERAAREGLLPSTGSTQ